MRRRTDQQLILLLFAIGVLAVLASFLGRAFFFMQEVGDFAATIDQRSPAAIKQQLADYAERLNDSNPMVRNAAIAAMKTATREDFGADAAAWLAWWRENGKDWEYTPAAPANK